MILPAMPAGTMFLVGPLGQVVSWIPDKGKLIFLMFSCVYCWLPYSLFFFGEGGFSYWSLV